MAGSNVKYKAMDYNCLTQSLVLTDINLLLFKDDVIIDKDVMIKFVQRSRDALLKLNTEIMTKEFKGENVQKILFLFPGAENLNYFESRMKNLLKTCKTKFPAAKRFLCVIDEHKELIPDTEEFIFLFFPFKNANEFNDFIDYKFEQKQIRLNYGRCHHLIIKYLEKRIKSDEEFETEGDNFVIKNGEDTLRFLRNAQDKTYLVYSKFQVSFLLKLTNSHLLGLYNFCLLFDLVELINTSFKAKIPFRIEKNEIVLFDQNVKNIENISVNEICKEIISQVNNLSSDFTKSIKFKIQLFNNCFVLNRCLKVSLSVMKILLDNNGFVEIAKLSFLYFKCFSITPICCRMQSLSDEAVVYDFEKYTYLHIQKNLPLYIELFKTLYFNAINEEIDNVILKNAYFEVIPVTLIQRFHGKMLEGFIKMLQKLKGMEISVRVLANGNFRIGKYFNFSADMLAKLFHIDKLKTIFESLDNLEIQIFRQEDFEEDSPLNFEYSNIVYASENAEKVIKINNLPICEKRCCKTYIQTVCILTFEHYQIFGIKICNKWKKEMIDVRLWEICKHFSQLFMVPASSLQFPVRQYCCNQYSNVQKGKMDEDICSQTWYNNFHFSVAPYESPAENHENWIYKQRFFFHKSYDKKIVSTIVDELLKIEEQNGVCLAFVKDRIELIENLNMALAELDADHYKATADFCYYNEHKLLELFETYHSEIPLLQIIHFEISLFGTLIINRWIKINPTTLLLNYDTFAMLVHGFTKMLVLTSPLFGKFNMLSTNQLLKKCDIKEGFAIAFAKAFNPLLKKLEERDFQLSAFLCVPSVLCSITEKEKLYDSLKIFRKYRMKVKISSEDEDLIFKHVIIDRFHLKIECLANNFTDFPAFSEKIEKINENFNGYIFILFPHYFKVLDYETVEQLTNIGKESEKLKMDEMKRFFKLFQDYNVKHLSIFEDEYFLINRTILIRPKEISLLRGENIRLFFEATENIRDFWKYDVDKWITLADEYNNTKKLEIDAKFSSFTIMDDNKNTYLKLAKTLTPCLEGIENDELMSYNWLELICPQYLMNKDKVAELLNIVDNVKQWDVDVYCSCFGICTKGMRLPVEKWLQISVQKISTYVEFLNSFQTLKTQENQELLNQVLTPSGLFSIGEVSYLNDSAIIMLQIPSMMSSIIETFFEYMKEMGSFLPITLDSSGNIMIGHYIYADIKDIWLLKCNFLKWVSCFENSMQQKDDDLMRSIDGLATKSNRIITLAKILNKNLKMFSNDLICDKNLKIIPTSLWKMCNSDANSYNKMINLFKLFENEKITWSLQLNGNIELDKKIVVTITDLLHFINLSQKNRDKLQKLKNLIRMLKTFASSTTVKLICEEEIKYGDTRHLKILNTKMPSFEQSLITAERLKKEQKITKYRILANGTLYLDYHLWIKAEDVMDNEIQIFLQLIKSVFPRTKFQYGNVLSPIKIFLTTTTDEQLYHYCYNLCKFVNEKYPNDINIKYFAEKNMFDFNDSLFIHPRSFFHLKDMEKVVEALKEFREFKQKQECLSSNAHPKKAFLRRRLIS